MGPIAAILYLSLTLAYLALVMHTRLRALPRAQVLRMVLAWMLIFGAGAWIASLLGLRL